MAGSDGGPGFPIGGIATALLLVASAVLVNQFPYFASRPPGSDPVKRELAAVQDVDARLWQDPFAAVTQHREEAARPLPGSEGVAPGGRRHRHDLEQVKETLRADVNGELAPPWSSCRSWCPAGRTAKTRRCAAGPAMRS
jgi:hypothetical protein